MLDEAMKDISIFDVLESVPDKSKTENEKGVSVEKKVSLWDFVNSVMQNKQEALLNDETKSAYSQFMLNRALSNFVDTAFIAQFANELKVSDEAHYRFLLGMIPPKKRWTKWPKKQSNENVKLIQEYFNCNPNRAIEYLRILDEEQINQIKSDMKVGGKSGK